MSAAKSASRGGVLLVLGMHRSGTSLLSGLLSQAGMDLGKSIMGAAEDNPSGFWENERIVALHEQLLNTLGQTWSSCGPLPADWMRSTDAAAVRGELETILEEEFQDRERICIKDPRLCRLLPLWRQLCSELDLDLACASIVRPATEVVASLTQRDSLGREHGRALWLRYNLEMVDNSEGLPLYRTNYETLLENAETTLAELSSNCGIALDGIDASLVDPGLRHHREAPQADATTRLYEILAAGSDPVPGHFSSEILPLAERLADMEGRLTGESVDPEALTEEELSSARERQLFEQAQEAKQYAGSMERELDTGRSYIEAMEAELKERQGYAQNLEQELAARDGDIETKAGFIASLEAELQHREEYAGSLKTELETQAGELARRSEYVESLSATLEQKDRELSDLRGALEQERAGHEAFVTAHEEDIARREEYTRSLAEERERLNQLLESKAARIAELEHKFRHFIRLGRALKGQAKDNE